MLLCFKNAARAAALSRQAAKTAHSIAEAAELEASAVFSLGIARVTGSDVSHVQIALAMSADRSASSGFGCVEPAGAVYPLNSDYSDKALWTLLEIPTTTAEDHDLTMWAKGRRGRRYDFTDIVGLELGRALSVGDGDICSRYAVEMMQDCLPRLLVFQRLNACMIAPGGFHGDPHGRSGLLELASPLGTLI